MSVCRVEIGGGVCGGVFKGACESSVGTIGSGPGISVNVVVSLGDARKMETFVTEVVGELFGVRESLLPSVVSGIVHTTSLSVSMVAMLVFKCLASLTSGLIFCTGVASVLFCVEMFVLVFLSIGDQFETIPVHPGMSG